MRQNYKEISLEESTSTTADLFQVKYDGIWAKLEIENDICSVFSRTGNYKKTIGLSETLMPKCELIGEFMFGSERSQKPELKGKVKLFDIISLNGVCLKSKTYAERYKILFVLSNNLTAQFELVKCYRIDGLKTAWDKYRGVEEGFVLKSSKGLYDDTQWKIKYEVTKDYYAVQFYRGQGKYENCLGAIGLADSKSGPEIMRVGGGFTDEERQAIWHDLSLFEGRCLEVSGKGEFASGALRHPNFLRWRRDKD